MMRVKITCSFATINMYVSKNTKACYSEVAERQLFEIRLKVTNIDRMGVLQNTRGELNR